MADGNHLIDRLAASAEGRADAPFAQLPDGTTLGYGALWEQAGRMAAALADMGLEPGDRVAVQVEKSIEAVALYLGTVMAGGIFLPLNTAYTPAEVGYFLGDAEPAVVVADPSRAAPLSNETEAIGAMLVTLAGDGSGSLARAAEGVEGVERVFAPVPRGEEDLAAILYTSGTTGRSKGAMLTHRNLSSNAEVLAEHWRFTKDDVLIHALPIFHTHGLFVALNVTLVAGGSVIWFPKFDADAVLDAIPRATAMMGVPTFYTRLLADERLDRARTANMRLFVSGSAPMLAETHRQWEERTGHRILERYGMTEAGMITSNPYEAERRPGTVGMPLPGVELKVADPETGEEVEQGEVGVIEARGPNVFKGYWRMPEKTREELRPDGWLVTGDLGQVDEDGYVSIVGRGKDLIISGGFNVYPKEVESEIDRIDGVLESAVIGVPHPDLGEGVVAVVVPEDDARLDEKTVMAPLENRLARFKQPKRVVFAPELPRNAMGKVQKAELRETHADSFADGKRG